jgi:N-acetylglucosaminyldiphosphoundecaprenol N-acetyl-beta-D-mannosaminyltransferase
MMSADLVMGYDVAVGTPAACVAEIVAGLDRAGSRRWLACINPHSYVMARRDPEFDAALRHADCLIPDGMGMVMASRVLNRAVRSRITGPEVFLGLHAALQARGGGSVFFLGGHETTLKKIRSRMAADYPFVRVAGTFSPPIRDRFSAEETGAMIRAVNDARPDVVWVGLTAPKQEKWIAANLSRLDARFVGAVGAAFDFYAGVVKPPPRIVQGAGLGWLYRLAQQPRRLWRRTFSSAPIFFWHLTRTRIGGSPYSLIDRKA